MKTISSIKIEKFRSCKKTEIIECSDFNVFSGKNNSGKSNILRSLNLFFKNEIEDSISIDIFKDSNTRMGEKKRIIISVGFDLDEKLIIQKTIKDVADFIPRKCIITKEYSYSTTDLRGFDVSYYIDGVKIEITKTQLVDQFLNLFNFRYIPSNKSAAKVLFENLKELQSELKFRYRTKYRDEQIRKEQDKKQSESIAVIKELAKEVFLPVASEIAKADPTIEDVSISTANEIVELINSVTYQIKLKSGTVLNEQFQGNGIQSILLYSILYLIDRNFHRKFGWKIATIWAVEEPESFLHNDLENQLANYLANNTSNNDERFQLFCSTHSNVFPQYANSHYWVEKEKDQNGADWTIVNKMNIHPYLMKLIENKITDNVALLSFYPLDEIILVEGYIDEYIVETLIMKKLIRNVKVFSISRFLNQTERAGCEELENYIKANSNLLKNRTRQNRITIMLDWDRSEEAKKMSSLKKIVKEPNRFVLLDFSKRNKLLDKSFRGIEAFYPIEVIEQLIKTSKGLILDRGDNLKEDRYYADSKRYGLVKNRLFELIKKVDLSIPYLEDVLFPFELK